MRKYKLPIIIVCISFLLILPAKGQNSSLLYYMNLPQNHLVNPAFRPLSSVYIGLPAVTGVDVGLRNNFLSFSDIFFPGAPGDSVISILHPDYNIEDFIAKLKSSNQIKLGTTIQTFGLGFAIGRNSYFFLDINERIDGRVSLPGDLVQLFLEGNESFAGKSIDLSSFGGNVTYFREAGFTFSTSPVKGLSIGVRPKFIMGIATATINNRDLRIDVGTDYSHTAVADLELNISGPVGVALTADNKLDSIWIEKDIDPIPFFTNTSNPGFGIDIGAKWDISDRFSVSGAILDLGLIKWNDSPTNLKATSSFTFEGFDITDVIDGTRTFDELTDEMLDSLKNSFIVSDDKKAFTTYLTPTLMLGGSFNLTGSLSIGLLTRSYISSGKIEDGSNTFR